MVLVVVMLDGTDVLGVAICAWLTIGSDTGCGRLLASARHSLLTPKDGNLRDVGRGIAMLTTDSDPGQLPDSGEDLRGEG